MMEEEVPAEYYNVEILRICCKGTDETAISDYNHLVKYEQRPIKVHDQIIQLKTVSFLNMSGRANNTNDDHLRANDSRIRNDMVQLNSYNVGWVLNGQSKSCLRCDKKFTVASWRHHCRLCGYLVCNRCSCYLVGVYVNVVEKQVAKKILLESLGSRVCVACYENKGGPDAVNYFSNPALEHSSDALRRSITGASVGVGGMGTGTGEPSSRSSTPTRRDSGSNLGEASPSSNTTRRSFSVANPNAANPLSKHSSAVLPANPAHAGATHRRASAPASAFSAAASASASASSSSRGVGIAGGRSGYQVNAFDPKTIPPTRPSDAQKLFGSAPPESPSAAAQLPQEAASVDKATKARMIQKFQEAKEAESRQNQERVQSIKRDPSRQVSSNTKVNMFVVKDQEKKGQTLSPAPAPTPFPAPAPTPAEGTAEEEEEVHAFNDADVTAAPGTPAAVLRTPAAAAQPPPVTPATAATDQSDLTFVSDLTPVNLQTLGTPHTLGPRVQFTSEHGVWEADSEDGGRDSPFAFAIGDISPLSDRSPHNSRSSEALPRTPAATTRDPFLVLLSDPAQEHRHPWELDSAHTPAAAVAPSTLERPVGANGGFFDSPFLKSFRASPSQLVGVDPDNSDSDGGVEAKAEAESLANE